MISPAARARLVLGAGAALGVAIAVRGVVRPARALPRDAVALVGAVPIAASEYARAVAAVEADRRDHQADPALRRHVLDRLIDEELLVQAALEMGLPTRDPRLRGQIAAVMLDGLVDEAPPPPDDAALRAFHASHAASFTRRGRVRVEALYLRGDDAVERAGVARARLLAGEPFGLVAVDAAPLTVPIPSAALSMAKLAEYVGPRVADAVDALAVGGLTAPVAVEHGAWVVRLLSRVDGALAPYASVRDEVLAEWRREEDDARLRRWLAQRRRATRVLVREALP